MKEYLELLGGAKSSVDRGFSQVGRALLADDPAHRALMLLASRAVAVSNALMLLALHHHANEGLPLLRSLLQIAVEMRWIAEMDSGQRAARFFDEHRNADWASWWNTTELRRRMRHFGFQKSLEERALLSCFDHLHANSQGLPWGHVFAATAHCGVTGQEALRAAAAAMGHVIKALDLSWPGRFEGAEELWDKTEQKAG